MTDENKEEFHNMWKEQWNEFGIPMDVDEAYSMFNERVFGMDNNIFERMAEDFKNGKLKNDVKTECIFLLYLYNPDTSFGINDLPTKYMDVDENANFNSLFLMCALMLSGIMTNENDVKAIKNILDNSIKKYAEMGSGKFNCWLMVVMNEYARCKSYYIANMEKIVINQANMIINQETAV